ncbi:MAG: DUF4143 domain-containing protein, partial [Candidatus Omnitrophica bacterium]|nr:DUF4143 domain-containing protein [Candidatus Omnitrophota bacterium]
MPRQGRIINKFIYTTGQENSGREWISNYLTTSLKLCAAHTGQILNFSNLANDCGVTHNTARSWLSVLEASYIIFLLPP